MKRFKVYLRRILKNKIELYLLTGIIISIIVTFIYLSLIFYILCTHYQ